MSTSSRPAAQSDGLPTVFESWGISTNAVEFIATLLQRCQFRVVATQHGQSKRDRHSTDVHVDCAVSGGADSLALMILARAAGFAVTAWHVDHGLRSGSESEADLVATAAQRFGAAFESRTVHVDPDADLEARARRARHGVLPSGVLFGHTAEDLAETVMLRLLRGTGPSGVAAMTPEQHPLLRIRRSETEQLCTLVGLEPFDDPTNTSPVFTRNRVRHELLPLMADIADRDVVPLLARYAELASEQRDFIERQAASLDATDVHVLRSVDPVLAREALRQWWLITTETGYPPDQQALERMMEVVSGDIPGCDVVSGWHLRRSQGKLSLQRLFPNDGVRG